MKIDHSEMERLEAALRAAGFGEQKIKDMQLVLQGKQSPQQWAEKTEDRESFYRRLLEGAVTDPAEEAQAFGIDSEQRRAVYLLDLEQPAAQEVTAVLAQLYSEDVSLAISERELYLIHCLQGRKGAEEHAEHILSTVNTELMLKLRIAYGAVAEGVKQLKESARQAAVAMQVMKRLYDERLVMDYESMGAGGLISALDEDARERFLKECFGEKMASRLDAGELTMVNRFFEHDLNISETARDLFLHRNTLVYHLEKVQKRTGLDIRHFDDACRLKLALMIEAYANEG